MDTSTTPTELNENTAAEAFATMFEPPKEPETPPPPTESEAEAAIEQPKAEEEAKENAQDEGSDPPEESKKVTVKVDGKTIELTEEEVAEAYKNGLRQADYTQKTQAVAEQRKAAEAEAAKARAERQELAQNLTRHQALLEGALQEQQKIDWAALLKSDPVEYLEQQRIAQERHAALQQTIQQKDALERQAQAEFQEGFNAHVADQKEKLLSTIPEWTNKAKMKAGIAEVREYLSKTVGLSEAEINGITDHRAIVQSRKAMLYDQMMAKASAAAKKIESAPQRVERPTGVSNPLDGRTALMQRINKSKSVSVEDAGQVFANLFNS